MRHLSWSPGICSVIAMVLALLGGCLGPTIQRETIFRSVPPYAGHVDIRIYPHGSTGEVLFETDVLVRSHEEFFDNVTFLQLLQARAARLGANVVIVRCTEHTPTGHVVCHLAGYRE